MVTDTMMADLNKVLESVQSFTDNPHFITEISKLSHVNDSTKMDKARLKEIFILHLNERSDEEICPDYSALPPGDYDSTLILIDQVCETIIDGIKKGLSVNETIALLKIFLEFLLIIKNIDLPVLVEKLQEILSKFASYFNQHGLKTVIEYISNTILPNHQLYKYLLTEEQERDQTFKQLLVNPIPVSQELSLACPEDKWHRQQKLLQREAEFEKGKAHIDYVQDKMSREKEQVEKTCNDLIDKLIDEGTPDESLGNVISMVTKMEADVIAKDLLLKVKQTEIELDFAMDKVNITVVPKKKQKN